MTREEAIRQLKKCRSFHNGSYGEAFAMAIEALKQDSVIDRVRAEIIELRSKQNVGVLECLDIIDKYRAESEE